MTREITTYNQIVGIKDNELWILEDSFQHSDDFKGVTGYHMDTITQSYIDDRNDTSKLIKKYDYLWREAVAAKNTELGLEEYIEMLQRDNSDDLFFDDDDSFRYQTKKLINNLPKEQKEKLESIFGVMGEDYVTWNCSGCGRCFNADDKWDYVFNPKLLEVITKYEATKV
jgi:hypothetical protein